MPPSSLLESAVYVRYEDHVLFKNMKDPPAEAIVRETIGWLTRETGEVLLIEHDRPLQNQRASSGHCNGVIVMKDSVLEIYRVPLEAIGCHLKDRNADDVSEYALQPKKRKTRKKKGAGAN